MRIAGGDGAVAQQLAYELFAYRWLLDEPGDEPQSSASDTR